MCNTAGAAGLMPDFHCSTASTANFNIVSVRFTIGVQVQQRIPEDFVCKTPKYFFQNLKLQALKCRLLQSKDKFLLYLDIVFCNSNSDFF